MERFFDYLLLHFFRLQLIQTNNIWPTMVNGIFEIKKSFNYKAK